MLFKKIISFIFLLFTVISIAQNTNRTIHSVDILKLAQKNGKNAGTARVYIDQNGVVKRNSYKDEHIDINSFTESVNQLVQKEKKVVKVDGDNDTRTGAQEPYNGQHIFITVIYQDDFYREKDLKNKTCYRYRETNLPVEQSAYSFFKYLNNSDLVIIENILK